MNEEYFLYLAELVWATRAKEKFLLGYTPESVVYHKQESSMEENHSAGTLGGKRTFW